MSMHSFIIWTIMIVQIVISTTSTDSYIIKTIITIYEKKNLIKSHIKKKKKKYIYWVWNHMHWNPFEFIFSHALTSKWPITEF